MGQHRQQGPMVLRGDLSDVLMQVFGSMSNQGPRSEYEGADVIDLNHDDVEIIADGLLLLHNVVSTVTHGDDYGTVDENKHEKMHAVQSKVAEILRRLHEGPELRLTLTPF